MPSTEHTHQIASHIGMLLGADAGDSKAFERCIASINEVIASAEAEAIAGLPGTREELLVAACHDGGRVD